MASKINFVVRLQHWMDSVPGQTFLNYAYSWGASIVIGGALCKLTHLPGGNFMLFLGMGTEVVVFFLSAFDRPFDRNEIGKELPRDYETDEEIAAKLGLDDADDDDDDEDMNEETETMPAPEATQPASTNPAAATANGEQPSGVVFVGGGYAPSATGAPAAAAPTTEQLASEAIAAHAAAQGAGVPFEAEAQRLAEIIRIANDELLQRAQAVLSPEMEQASQEYIEKLRCLADTFGKVDEQSVRLTRDSEEMANLNRTLTAINKTYDLHFKSISQQVGTIEEINAQTRRLAEHLDELNNVYARMIQAMTVNMPKQP